MSYQKFDKQSNCLSKLHQDQVCSHKIINTLCLYPKNLVEGDQSKEHWTPPTIKHGYKRTLLQQIHGYHIVIFISWQCSYDMGEVLYN